ncbi:uncharacterized protein LOC112539217 [Tetranychus urticae]|uniref:uncharacterized protein LOC112539217 n=1 Tax=Tetranychus urticae TaxID=32264 RepID=UPI000D648A19|nr:uncharacterized protein LOC112539217 [Tetranychus urticae]
MEKTNLTVGAFSVPFVAGFVEEDDQVVPNLKSLKQFAAMLSDYGPFNLTFILPEEGQLGVLTETGYHDGVLGLLQEGKADMCFLPLPLDTQKAPGYFASVISEEEFYIVSVRNLYKDDSAIISSLTSISVVPLLLAVLLISIMELITVKYFKIAALVTSIYQGFGVSMRQHFTRRSSWLCLIQMLILMFPVFVFNAAFSTQTIVGTADYKIDTLRDIIDQGKIPFFIEGVSMHDYFKAKVTKDYADNYERAVAEGFKEPFPLGPIPSLERKELMVTFISGVGKKLGPLATSSSDLLAPNQEQYYSAKPFHKSLQAVLFSYNASKLLRNNFDILSRRVIQSGITKKIEGDIYIDFILSFNPATLYDFHKSEVPRKVVDLSWHSLNYRGFYKIFYLLIFMLTLSIVVLLIELVFAFLTQSK